MNNLPSNRYSHRLRVAAGLVSTLTVACAASDVAGPTGGTSDASGPVDHSVADPAANPSVVAKLYKDWARGHEAGGGDTAVSLKLSAFNSLSADPMGAEGIAKLDLIKGHMVVQLDGLSEAGDVWLVDNQDGGSVLPDAADNMVRIGTLELVEGADQFALETDIDPNMLKGFRVDVVAISEEGRTPVEAGLLFGRTPLFNRMYTQERIAKEQGLDARGFINTSVYVPSLARLDEGVARGFYLFTDETFDGNGRTCATCHRADNNFTIDADYIKHLPASDPLFVHEQVPALAELESPQMLRKMGLVRGHVDGFDKPARLRAVPTIQALATSINTSSSQCARAPIPNPACGFPPNVGPLNLRGRPVMFGPLSNAKIRENIHLIENTGWGGDGAPHDGSLLNFSFGAIAEHMTKTLNRVAGVDYRLPTEQEADDLLLFQLAVGRQTDIDTNKLAFTDAKVEAGRKLFDLSPGGCKDAQGVPHCACDLDINGNPCGIDRPAVADGASCGSCHHKGSANSDLTQLPNVAGFANLNFDIGTVARPNPKAEQISTQYGEPLPQDCGFGRLTADEFDPMCHYVVSFPPYSYNSLCRTGPELPPFDCYRAPMPPGVPPLPLIACSPACGGPGLPACNGWGPNVLTSNHLDSRMPIHGKNPFQATTWPLGWYLSEGSLCDMPSLSLPIPLITAGMPSEAVCENLLQPLEWSATGGQAFCTSNANCDQFDRPGSDSSCNAGFCSNVPGCKCVDNSSCRTESFCFRQPGSPIDGYCLGLEKPKTKYDPNNPAHVARASNRAMVEPPPVWSAFARVGTPGGMLPPGIPGAKGDACNPFLNGTPAAASNCFGPQICKPGPFNPAAGTCDENPNWQPEVLSFCEFTQTYPNTELPFGCFPGSPNPACQGCIPWNPALHEAWADGTSPKTRVKPVGVPPPCFINAVTPPIEDNCGANNPPFTPGAGMEGYGDGTFTTPAVIEAADTAPFFHNNSAATLEDAIAHYTSAHFNDSRGGKFPNIPTNIEPISLDNDEIGKIAAYMRVLNAIQNITQAQKALEQAWFDPASVPGDGRIAYADSELEDAIQVLKQSKVHVDVRARLTVARVSLGLAFNRPGNWSTAAVRLALASALYQMAQGRDAMVSLTSNSGDLEMQQWIPDLNDVISGTIDGETQTAQESAFEDTLTTLLAE